ncbi:hypothetical protein V2I01_27595 [Micromonospora sp. BRA006-A]|nr:hypothetical protein [Micromonospora sp. BRA006-A]
MTTEEPSRPAPAPAIEPATADRARPGPVRRLRDAARDAAPALAVYAVIRLIGVAAVYVWARSLNLSPVRELTLSDATYYLAIAQRGYDGYERVQSDMAFFPLYPALIGVVERVTPLGPRTSGLAVATLAGLVAAWALTRSARTCTTGAPAWYSPRSGPRCRTPSCSRWLARRCSPRWPRGRCTRCCAGTG